MADVSVRLARLADVSAMARVQISSWRAMPALAFATEPDSPATVRAWERAITLPPSPRHQVWVALEADEVVGLAAVGPASDPDLEVASSSELLVLTTDPAARRRGHASRMLAATAEALVADGQQMAVAWLLSQNDAGRAFLQGSGWDNDGAHRTLSDDENAPPERQVRQLRMGTELMDR